MDRGRYLRQEGAEVDVCLIPYTNILESEYGTFVELVLTLEAIVQRIETPDFAESGGCRLYSGHHPITQTRAAT